MILPLFLHCKRSYPQINSRNLNLSYCCCKIWRFGSEVKTQKVYAHDLLASASPSSVIVVPTPLTYGSSRGQFVVSCCGPRQGNSKPPKKSNSSSQGIGFGKSKRKDPTWGCVQDCGACCKLDKGPSFATPEEIFQNPSDIELYKSMVGSDGWCIHYEKTTRKCSIYSDRPYFCRVEPGIFKDLYGIEENKFNKEACSCCRDTIKAIYGAGSQELEKFNQNVRNLDST